MRKEARQAAAERMIKDNPHMTTRQVADAVDCSEGTVTRAAHNLGVRLPRPSRGGSGVRKILDIMAKHPDWPQVKVARKLGIGKAFVCNVACTAREIQGWIDRLSPENKAWLTREANESKVTLLEMLDEIVTDARLSESE